MAAVRRGSDILDSSAPLSSEGGIGAPRRGSAGINVKDLIPERVNAEISKRYDIDAKEIGSGGYGKVFVAKDRQMQHRKVAIKKVLVHDHEKKQAFMREVKIMKDLDHPNICKLLETYEQGRFMFFVMELCEGREVFDRIFESGSIAENTTADIVRQSASALKYAHGCGVAHRDMKPENICFCTDDVQDNHVKVIDWGLGFYFGQARMVSAVGSLTYAAPEVIDGSKDREYYSSCDQWSLGVVTYVMLCGKPPFWGNQKEQLRKMRGERYPMQDATWQAISKDAKDLIQRLLKNKPEDRMSLDQVLAHPWLKSAARSMDPTICKEILTNMKQFSTTSQFFSLCIASVARQLDHKSLRDVHKVFCELDTNGDGVLELSEVKAGFEKMYGRGSEQLRDIEELFARLDLDGSGTIDYTEFCAAGIGERLSTEEFVLWGAFKAFDVNDDDGKITKDEIKKVLQRADVDRFWTDEICDDLSSELFKRFDKDKSGSIEFPEWVTLMRDIASRRSPDQDPRQPEEQRKLREMQGMGGDSSPGGVLQKNYNLLVELDKTDRDGSPRRGQGSSLSKQRQQSAGFLRAFSGQIRNNAPGCIICSGGAGGSSSSSSSPSGCLVM